MKVLITGGYGFIGSRLASNLHKRGNRVTIFDKPENGSRKCCASLKDIPFTSDPFELDSTYTAIIHLGSPSSTTITEEQARDGYDMSMSFMRQAAFYKVPFLYASSAGVYGTVEENLEGSREDDQCCPLSAYAGYKLKLDNDFKDAFNKGLISGCGFRFFNVWSASGEEHKKQPSGPFKFLKELEATGTMSIAREPVLRDWVSVTDVVRVISCALKSLPTVPILNVGTGMPFSFQEVAEIIRRKKGGGRAVKNFTLPESVQLFTMANTTLLTSFYGKRLKTFKEEMQDYDI